MKNRVPRAKSWDWKELWVAKLNKSERCRPVSTGARAEQAWQVREVKLELEMQRVTVRIECEDDVIWGNPSTG